VQGSAAIDMSAIDINSGESEVENKDDKKAWPADAAGWLNL